MRVELKMCASVTVVVATFAGSAISMAEQPEKAAPTREMQDATRAARSQTLM